MAADQASISVPCGFVDAVVIASRKGFFDPSEIAARPNLGRWDLDKPDASMLQKVNSVVAESGFGHLSNAWEWLIASLLSGSCAG